MCGRYHLVRDPREALDAFGAAPPRPSPPFSPRYNIAPSEPPLPPDSRRRTPPRVTRVPVARRAEDGAEATADEALWPLVPPWANGQVTRYSTANARAEGLAESRTYRRPWERGQRCLIPASGFYEWQDAGGRVKQPWTIEPLNDALFTFGGLWEMSFTSDDTPVLSCTIVTVAANPLMREIHNAGKNRHRMPLIVAPEHRDAWLGGSLEDASALIVPYPADEMRAYEISTAINNPGFDDPTVLEPLRSTG